MQQSFKALPLIFLLLSSSCSAMLQDAHLPLTLQQAAALLNITTNSDNQTIIAAFSQQKQTLHNFNLCNNHYQLKFNQLVNARDMLYWAQLESR